ncbi:MAG: hypothetical protein ACI867_002442, partial [Glaciecola sp.]
MTVRFRSFSGRARSLMLVVAVVAPLVTALPAQ